CARDFDVTLVLGPYNRFDVW
nr:immunoglobulin heavy chain junction region [Macaca mulatta]MOV38177.1 immunoglobulin heavy chain junction region [Macaca mulatta]MOV41647.1 immunoglobulin heavy chain junction region [Macaca mulatta]MOV44696.1 immunoglobulin heavy chain junction region [Macaca mulatta]